MSYSKERIEEFLTSVYKDYKEPCDIIINKILEQKKEYSKDDLFLRGCAAFYVLGSMEARENGKPEPNLDDYITDFMPIISNIISNSVAHSPKNFIMPNSKLINSIAKYGAAGYDEITATKVLPKYPDIKTTATLIFDENISLPKNFTQYDRAVFNAICSIYEAGNNAFTPTMVFRTMTGRTKEETIDPSNLTRVVNSIEKQRATLVKIDCSGEFEKRKDVPNIKSFDDNILPVRAATIIINGTETRGYAFRGKPLLYEYCGYTKQIITVPIHLLNTKTVKNTPEIIVIKEYLIRQIELLKHTQRNNNNILYDTIFSECGITTDNRTTLKRYRDYIKKLLEIWIEKDYIKAYKEYKRGAKIMGVEIKP